MSTPPARDPRRRSDGERTHTAILEVATQIASVDGIHGLTIGRLASELGVSKSGLYAHFGSKEQLQRETIAAAATIVRREVVGRAFTAPEGRARLEALIEAFFSYVERGVFRGGCFFAALLAELDAHPGPLRDVVADVEQAWHELIVGLARQAQQRGEIAADIDVAQLAFELRAVLDFANYQFMLTEDQQMIERGRTATARLIAQAPPAE